MSRVLCRATSTYPIRPNRVSSFSGSGWANSTNSKRFLRLIERLDEVQEAYALTGDADYLVKLAVPDLKALSRVLNEVFLPHESVAHVRSSIVLEHLKQSARLPLEHLAVATDAGPKRTPRKRRSHAR